MKKVALGTTGIEVSALGMGAIQITRLDWNESIRLVHEVMDLGINLFDTARGYLDSELRLGDAFYGRRDRVILISKSGAGDAATLGKNIDETLQRLKTDYLDVFLFHGGDVVNQDNFCSPGGILQTASDAVKAGKIRFLGFSTHRVETAMKALTFNELKVAMVPANFMSREYIDGDFKKEACGKGVAVLAMKPFGGGRMVNARVCLKFLKNYPDLIPCIGIEKVSEMVENIKIWEDEEPLTGEDYNEMLRMKALLGERYCRGCGYCMPCPEGIEIPTVTFLKIFAKQMPKDTVVIPEHLEIVKKAGKCVRCGKCIKKCPFSLAIPDMIEENIQFYKEFSAS